MAGAKNAIPKPSVALIDLQTALVRKDWFDFFSSIAVLLNGGSLLTQAVTDTLYEKLGLSRGVNTQTGNYTLVLADQGKTIEMNVAGANTLTIPPNASVAFPIGAWMNIVQVGAGQTTITAGVGVTLRTRVGPKLISQWAMATLYQRVANEWVAGGSLSA